MQYHYDKSDLAKSGVYYDTVSDLVPPQGQEAPAQVQPDEHHQSTSQRPDNVQLNSIKAPTENDGTPIGDTQS